MSISWAMNRESPIAAVAAVGLSSRHVCAPHRPAAAAQRVVTLRLASISAARQRQQHSTFSSTGNSSSSSQQSSILCQTFIGAVSLAASLCLHLGSVSLPAVAASPAYAPRASAAEDALLEFDQQVGAKLGSAFDVLQAAAGGIFASISVGGDASAGGSAYSNEAAEARDLIHEVWEVVDQNFSDVRGAGFDRSRWAVLRDKALARKPRSRAAAHAEIRGMLATLHDPYSRFIPPQEFKSMLKYDVSGVGLNLGTAEEFADKTGLPLPADRSAGSSGTWVVGLIKGSPAEAAGLRQGDELLELAGAPLGSRSPFEVASLLSGEDEESISTGGHSGSSRGRGRGAGSSVPGLPPVVRLRVRHLDGRTEQLTLQRQLRRMYSPVIYRLGHDSSSSAGASRTSSGSNSAGPTGYIRLSSLNVRARRDVLAAVRELERKGAARLVLDLRGNRGGLVAEGVEVARLFLEDDAPVVSTEGRSGVSAAPILAPGPAATRAPLAVLVDGQTASASEILAGALHDNCRAVLVGGQTYGKGMIQSVYELHDSSGLALTVGKYLTPAGTDIDREGLQPDFHTLPAPEVAARAVAACQLRLQQHGGNRVAPPLLS